MLSPYQKSLIDNIERNVKFFGSVVLTKSEEVDLKNHIETLIQELKLTEHDRE